MDCDDLSPLRRLPSRFIRALRSQHFSEVLEPALWVEGLLLVPPTVIRRAYLLNDDDEQADEPTDNNAFERDDDADATDVGGGGDHDESGESGGNGGRGGRGAGAGGAYDRSIGGATGGGDFAPRKLPTTGAMARQQAASSSMMTSSMDGEGSRLRASSSAVLQMSQSVSSSYPFSSSSNGT